MNVLAIGAHYDDLELGCGGALARHVREGDNVIGFIATSSAFSDNAGKILREKDKAKEEAKTASSLIGYKLISGDIDTFQVEFTDDINVKLLKIIEENKIDLIYTHWINDIHHDHRNIALATLHAARHVNKVLMYKSNWYISECEFKGNFYIDITETWDIKEKAIRAYKTEMDRVGECWINFFKNEAINNGFKVNVKYAESYQVAKWMV